MGFQVKTGLLGVEPRLRCLKKVVIRRFQIFHHFLNLVFVHLLHVPEVAIVEIKVVIVLFVR